MPLRKSISKDSTNSTVSFRWLAQIAVRVTRALQLATAVQEELLAQQSSLVSSTTAAAVATVVVIATETETEAQSEPETEPQSETELEAETGWKRIELNAWMAQDEDEVTLPHQAEEVQQALDKRFKSVLGFSSDDD